MAIIKTKEIKNDDGKEWMKLTKNQHLKTIQRINKDLTTMSKEDDKVYGEMF